MIGNQALGAGGKNVPGRDGGRPLGASDIGERLGERATLVQFSSAFCQPCRATRRVLADVAALVPGVAHVEIDAEARLDLVRELRVVKTPTVLVLDAAGHEVRRAAGQPRKADVIAALGEAV
ncbi:thioredoxin family protein [Streptomyces sp. NPDC005865]|uniref:thioredoxin family protein n=1 Tax=Streptomyces sp. NPDC005865 TaxID=3155453 RepID=UPI0033C9C9D9